MPLAFTAAVGAALTAGVLSSSAADLVAYWNFEKVEADGTSIKAVVGPYTGTIMDAAVLTPAGEGRPGGGKGFDVSSNNKGYLLLEATGDDNPMNKAAVNDQVSVVLWQKNNANLASSSFWAVSDSQARGFQFHVPWSDGAIYFDTMGCCNANQRLNQNVEAAMPGFDWTAWHHYAFIKDGARKAIYIDGVLLKDQEGYDALTPDFNALYIGSASDKNSPDAVIDDFAIYKGALSEAEIKKLVAGAVPGGEIKDTDKDGMPDDWETQYGFNPNDPSDAAQDADHDGVSNLDEYKAGTNPIDAIKPTLTSVAGTESYDTVIVTFSEAVDPVTGTNKANYAITPNLAIKEASLKNNIVTLTTDKQTSGATAYTLTVNNVQDTSKNVIVANSQATFYSYIAVRTGVLRFAYWGNINGAPVDGLTSDPRYPASPDLVTAVFSFNSRDAFPNDSHENYGATMEGYLTPTESASYRFFVYSDDASQLFLSTDDKEANLVLIAEETSCCNVFTEPDSPRTSEPIALVAGKKYFVRLIYKEGGGGDYGQVAWRKEGNTTAAASLPPIPGKFLSSAVDLPAPPQGAYLSQNPAPGAKNISPGTRVTIAHRDGKTEWTAANVTLKFDGAAVTPTSTKDGNVLTIDYAPSALLASKSTHTITLGFLDAGGLPATQEWTFETLAYSGPTKDKIGGYPALITGSSVFTADAAGHSGKAGDTAMDTTTKGGPLVVLDAKWANAATAKDEISVAYWAKQYDVLGNSAFWFTSPSSSGTARGYQAHAPWSGGDIYFDTAGCCDAPQRITANISTFADYPGDETWWNQWHYFVFSKKGINKQIWIDGKLFLEGTDAAPLPTDFSELRIGSDGSGASPLHGVIDDFAVFSTQLAEADIKSIVAGGLPSALPASKGLIAYWDFNDAVATPVTPPTLSAARTATGLTITFAGKLLSAPSVAGPWTPVAGAASPLAVTAAPGQTFYRASN